MAHLIIYRTGTIQLGFQGVPKALSWWWRSWHSWQTRPEPRRGTDKIDEEEKVHGDIERTEEPGLRSLVHITGCAVMRWLRRRGILLQASPLQNDELHGSSMIMRLTAQPVQTMMPTLLSRQITGISRPVKGQCQGQLSRRASGTWFLNS